MSQPAQPELLPDHRRESITVSSAQLAATLARLRDLGAVVLAFNVSGATYTLELVLPDGVLLEQWTGANK